MTWCKAIGRFPDRKDPIQGGEATNPVRAEINAFHSREVCLIYATTQSKVNSNTHPESYPSFSCLIPSSNISIYPFCYLSPEEVLIASVCARYAHKLPEGSRCGGGIVG